MSCVLTFSSFAVYFSYRKTLHKSETLIESFGCHDCKSQSQIDNFLRADSNMYLPACLRVMFILNHLILLVR